MGRRKKNPTYREHEDLAKEMLEHARQDLANAQRAFSRGDHAAGHYELFEALDNLTRASAEANHYVIGAPEKELEDPEVEALIQQIDDLQGSVRRTLEHALGTSIEAVAPHQRLPTDLQVLPGGRPNPCVRHARAVADKHSRR